MPTTFSVSFKNKTIDSLTGRASTTSILQYINPYSGAQAADPATTPAGTFVYSAAASSIPINTYMTQPAGGVSSLSMSRSANAVNAVTIAVARVYDAAAAAMIDVVASTAGGGGGAIFPNLTSSAGIAFQLDAFSLKLPLSSGTILLNAALANAVVSAWVVTAANVALGSSASINIYDGVPPASADLPATGTLLATFTTAATGASWAAASAGSAALVSPLSTTAVATSTATYARIVKGTYVLQGAVGTIGTDFILSTTALVSGVAVSLTNATITL